MCMQWKTILHSVNKYPWISTDYGRIMTLAVDVPLNPNKQESVLTAYTKFYSWSLIFLEDKGIRVDSYVCACHMFQDECYLWILLRIFSQVRPAGSCSFNPSREHSGSVQIHSDDQCTTTLSLTPEHHHHSEVRTTQCHSHYWTLEAGGRILI